MKKLCSLLLTALLFIESVGLAIAAAPETMQEKLDATERAAYGQPQTGALLDRLAHLEKDFWQASPQKSVVERTDALYAIMLENEDGPSLVTQMNAVEWAITQEVSMESIQKRVGIWRSPCRGVRRKALIASGLTLWLRRLSAPMRFPL